MYNIEMETFEAWLFAQPDEREWNYMDGHKCMICSFIKETSSAKDPGVGGSYYRVNGEHKPLPRFLHNRFEYGLLSTSSHGVVFSAKTMKERWLKMFPETEITIPAIVVIPKLPIQA
jgi:hypothetical protein